jgi:Na+/phosphate symporter
MKMIFLQEGSPSCLPESYESEYKIKDFFNKIPKNELTDLQNDNEAYILNKNLEWEQIIELQYRLRIYNEKDIRHNELRRDRENSKQ